MFLVRPLQPAPHNRGRLPARWVPGQLRRGHAHRQRLERSGGL